MADPVINEKEQPATGSERRSIDVSPTQRSPRRKPPPKLEGSETRTSTASRSSGSVGGSSTVRGTVDEHTIAGTMTKAEPGSDTSEPGGEQFSYAAELAKDIQSAKDRGLDKSRGLTLSWDHLSVRARGGLTDIQFKSDLLSIFWPFREMKQHRRINKAVDGILANEPESEKQMFFTKGDKTPKRGEPGLRKGQRYLLHDFTGCLKPGEMNLVVGRPGSGCSTLLKTLAGLTHAYAGVDGDVRYGAMTSGSRAFSRYRSVVVFNGEDDVHDPNLLVDYTMDFALRMQTPSGRARPLIPGTEKAMSKGRWVAQQKDTILAAFGIQHTGRTKVGDQYVRGVSGGEKKRVSLAEALTADGAIYCWDNATRGLDASTALSFAHLCRTLCDVANRINIVSLYQAGNGIYDLCDKVTVVAEGHIIYFGPRAEARGYFEALGFEHIEGANTADYLTAVTALNERRVRPGFEGRVPSKPSEFATAYRNSDVCARMDAEAAAERNDAAARQEETADMQRYLDAAKAPTAFPFLPYKADVFAQIRACSIREAQVRWGDQWSLWGRQVTTLIQGFVNGSVFYNLPLTTNGLYLRGGVLFLLVLFPAILSFADVASAFVGRNVLAKHKSYSMYAPAAIIFAQTLLDAPTFLIQMIIYCASTYWLAGLKASGALFVAAICFAFFVTNAITALFRTIGYSFGNYNDASKVSGTIFTIFVLYSGYIIYTPSMKRWFSWTRWVNPVYYGLESLIVNEFDGLTFECAPPNLAPWGPGYEGGPAGCAIQGARPGSTQVSGKTYMHVALWFFKKHNWRNLAIITALWVSSAVLGMIMLELQPAAGSTKNVLLFKQGGGGDYIRLAAEKGVMPIDEEEGPDEAQVFSDPTLRVQPSRSRLSDSRAASAAAASAAGATTGPAGAGVPARDRSGSASSPPKAPKLASRATFGFGTTPSPTPSPKFEPLHRWGTTDSQNLPREWPPLSLCRTVSNPHEDGRADYVERRRRRSSASATSGPRMSPTVGVGQLDTAIEEDEGGAPGQLEVGLEAGSEPQGDVQLTGTTFTWKDLDYTVKAEGKDKQLLRKVSGYCKAGTITALMGSSGAGKTTLMDVLAARKDEGIITGQVLLNGQALPVSFQRTTGYCEQVDVHLPEATVREALEFSALLRQPRSVSKKDKLAYVDEIIDLLELHDIADAIIGKPGSGLGVEQRKRLTIGVELVSRPSLLFLDEPTSGLDGQSSYLIVGFLQKLAAAGQSILCTIHQPSASLFAGFDMLLLLKAGGRTVYFGPVADVPYYFIEQGVDWPKNANPAEFMIDIVSGPLAKERDWADVWLNSEERTQMLVDLEKVNAQAQAAHTGDDHAALGDENEFAASTLTQMRLVFDRSSLQLYRNTEYVTNKCLLHISTALITGFSFFKLKNSFTDLKNHMFVLFQFVFVAPGVIVQTQPKFIANRDIFEAREKKAKFYSWQVFCFGEIIAEAPYLLICAVLFWGCWYPTAGLEMRAWAAGPVFLQMVFYEFLYTGMGQFIAAYAPNPVFAAMVLPLFIAVLAIFSGVLVPYSFITPFWRYTMYYVDPFTYLLKGLLTFPIWHIKVHCKPSELGIFDPPPGQTCGQYLAVFLENPAVGYVDNPDATENCGYCPFRQGNQYLATMNIKHHVNGWEGILVTLLFVVTSYTLVFLLLKLRSKATKTAS